MDWTRQGKRAIAIVVTLLWAQAALAQWYAGGTLHKGTLSEWRHASEANRLATAADFVAGALGNDRFANLVGGDMDRLRPLAIEMKRCIDEVAVEQRLGRNKVVETAAACALLLGY